MRDVTLQGCQLRTVGPHCRGPDEQAGVVDSLERELNPPVLRPGWHRPATATLPARGRARSVIDILLVAGPVAGPVAGVLALALVADSGGLDAEAGAHRLGGRVRRGVPGPQRLGERLTLGGGHVEDVGDARAG